MIFKEIFNRSFRRIILNHPSKLLHYSTFRKVMPYTMQRYGGLCQVYDMANQIDDEHIDGNIVEMGCWKGGTAALMGYVSKKNKSDRSLWLFDSFQGLPEPTEADREQATKKTLKIRERERERYPINRNHVM